MSSGNGSAFDKWAEKFVSSERFSRFAVYRPKGWRGLIPERAATGSLVITNKRLIVIKEQGLGEGFRGGPEVNSVAQIPELLASHGGIALSVHDIQEDSMQMERVGRGAFTIFFKVNNVDEPELLRGLTIPSQGVDSFAEHMKALLFLTRILGDEMNLDPYFEIIKEFDFSPSDFLSAIAEEMRYRVSLYIAGVAEAYRLVNEQAVSQAGNLQNDLEKAQRLATASCLGIQGERELAKSQEYRALLGTAQYVAAIVMQSVVKKDEENAVLDTTNQETSKRQRRKREDQISEIETYYKGALENRPEGFEKAKLAYNQFKEQYHQRT